MTNLFSGYEGTAQEDAIEAEAFIAWHSVCSGEVKDEHNFQCLPLNRGCALSLPRAPGPVLNRVFGLSTVSELDEAYGWMTAKAGARFLQLNIESASDEVKRWIAAKGLHEKGPAWAKLVRSSEADVDYPPSDVTCRKVLSSESELFGSIICSGFGLPENLIPVWASIVEKVEWSCFFAVDGDTPIGTGAMYTSGNRSWLGGGTVLPAFRNRGAQKALIRARIDEGMARGTSTFVVEAKLSWLSTANISYDNLKKLGFEHVYSRSNFVI
ncbi:GNAT family N-acetyltransferase [Rhizobium sp. Leaf262]|uniref:GNAT family N-acetyltransferase n=1 Tax=Rhizobium sp. Leaf262 TaxID=1736312 RepID=UPI000A8F0894|nr:GNAT family N-acetyltransferase [Rhizobium sp. Leaf262]